MRFNEGTLIASADGRRRLGLTVALGALSVGLLAAPGVFAQETPAEELELLEIIVTGTRVSGFTAPTPVTSIGQADLESRAVRNLADIMFDTPALKPAQNTGQSSQPIGASNFDLRGLGPNRTLVLVDGRRFAATDPTGGIDVNVIPAALIKRLEIVTGGASAAYGSDAVSGVVNIFLDDRFEGAKGSVQYSQSKYDDHHKPAASVAVGKAFGRFHLVAAGDYFKDDGQLNQSSRPWARGNYAVLTNPAYPATAGQTRLVIAPDARFSQMTLGGVTVSNSIPALRNLQFGPGGTVLPFTRGTYVGSTFMSGGDGASLSDTSNISPEIERGTGFAKLSFDATEDISFFADALYSRADIFSDGTTSTDNGPTGILIQRDNAFLPSQIRSILVANNQNNFRIGRVGAEEGAFFNTVENEVQRYGLGVNGRFGDGWRWDASGQFSRVRYYREDGNNRNNARFSLGVDSVINPVTGQPVCRALLNNPNPTAAQDPYGDIRACVPINLFGAGSVSQAALDYIGGTAFLDSRQEQDVYAMNIEGSPFATWAGDVSIAAGAEYRREKVRATNDDVSKRSGWKTVNPQALRGSLNVKEAYTELVVPLLADQPLAQSLDLNLAGRVTDYSTSGRVETWKAGANYQPVDDIRLRATLSRDIRAANINELFSGQNQLFNTITNPLTNVALTTLQLTGGNPNLRPERSKSFTGGVVYQPEWLPGFRASVDHFSFKIKDAITSLSGQQIVDGCLVVKQDNLCSAITFDANNVITRVQATLVNAARSTAKGLDFEAMYSFDLDEAKISVRGLATYIDELTVTSNGITTNYAGTVGSTGTLGPAGGIPKWRGTLSADYTAGVYALGAVLRYVDGGKLNVGYVEGVDIPDNSVPSRTYVDINGKVTVTDAVEIYGAIDNLFNKAPPLTPNAVTAPSYASSVFYDRIGRTYAVGARFKF